jgi:hypothetical protein
MDDYLDRFKCGDGRGWNGGNGQGDTVYGDGLWDGNGRGDGFGDGKEGNGRGQGYSSPLKENIRESINT